MTINGILLKTNRGYTYIGDHSGSEKFLRVDTDHPEMGKGLAEEYLELHDSDADTISVDGQVLDASQIPVDKYAVGDLMAGRTIQSIPISMGTEGEAVIALEIGDKLAEEIAALERRIERSSRGVATRDAVPQINAQPEAKGNDKTPPPYSIGQPLYPSRSPAWSVPAPFWVAFMELTLEEPGTEPSLIRLWRNSEMVGECWIKAGEKRAVVKVRAWTHGIGFTPKDFIIMEIKVAGADSANLAVVLRGTMTGD